MLRLAIRSLRLAPLLLLAACATEPGGMAASAPPDSIAGTWIVTDAFPAGPVTDMASAPRGQRVRLDPDMAGDVAGRACPWPSYAESMGAAESVLGHGGAATPQPILTVMCAGEAFARYAVQADGSLLTRFGAWLLRLEHGEKLATNPAPMTPEAVPMPLVAPPPPAATTPPAVMAPPTLVYLASYRTEAWARKGWGILSGQAASLKGMEPVMRSVDIKGMGKFIRLFAPAQDGAQAKAICKELSKAIAECGAAGRDK
ncbi:hypothetical protein A6A04_00230 [Paramagnetospirillum marisnigri]|uniref:SPOR domain-containing protein n=1 Tax=Paramagnetospirillum marisnigri TaxID=1285242 RepID=A0A178MUA0_9PROT|nr:hypothetical protein [Paramagnetospirillum marisnigri]OAN52397.1 hypothetical protein A6A04_00230 [Paramagnetospirillum marisnigri]